MALQLKLAFLQRGGCRSFSLFEKTGEFLTDFNEGGYGAPNPATSDVAAAFIVVTLPDSTTQELDITNNFSALFPTTDDSVELNITNEDLGFAEDEQLPAGIYRFVYSLYDVDGNALGEGTFHFLVDCTLYCCLDNLLATLPVCDCCDDLAARTKMFRVRMAYTYLAAAQAAAGCGKHSRAHALLEFVSDICRQQKCNCN